MQVKTLFNATKSSETKATAEILKTHQKLKHHFNHIIKGES